MTFEARRTTHHEQITNTFYKIINAEIAPMIKPTHKLSVKRKYWRLSLCASIICLNRKYSRLQELKYGPGTMHTGFPSSLGFGVGGWSYSNFLASAVVYTSASKKSLRPYFRAFECTIQVLGPFMDYVNSADCPSNLSALPP